ncbi:MAG: class A beta-lactamase-related serine hydrolase [Gemmatimonadota bacterium]|nr:class A beta-lactamase-related serine hydrolase [Gemmatimonadota bacterium]
MKHWARFTVTAAGSALLLSAHGAPQLAFAQSQSQPRTTARESVDSRLQSKLETLVRAFKGDVGIYVRNLKTGRSASIRPDELFPTASTIKVPILIGTFDAMQKGKFTFQQMMTYNDSLKYSYDDSVQMPRAGAQIPIAKLTLQMITESNNTSALWLQGLVRGDTINEWLHSHGFDSTRVNSRIPAREVNRKKYGWGQTTPRELASLLVLIRNGQAVSAAASEEMYRHLTRIYWNGEALSQLPPWVQAASKQGMVDHSRSEVVLVNAPSGDYVFAILTKNQQDSSYVETNDGYTLIRALSALLWREFEPKHPFTPQPDARRFKPPEEP